MRRLLKELLSLLLIVSFTALSTNISYAAAPPKLYLEENGTYISTDSATIMDQVSVQLKVASKTVSSVVTEVTTENASLSEDSLNSKEAYYTLTLKVPLDSEPLVIVTATDERGKKDSISLTFKETPVAGPVFIAEDLDISVTEDETGSGSLIYSVENFDPVSVEVSDLGTPTHGSVSASGLDLTYTPFDDLDYLASGQSLIDTFSATLIANGSFVSNAIVTVTILGTNDPPVLNTSVYNLETDMNQDVSVSIDFTDPDNDQLSISSYTPMMGQSLAISDNILTYRPGQDYTGVDTFDVTFTDGGDGFVTGSFSVTVNEVAILETYLYVALGDSITKGTVAPTFSDNKSYIGYFEDELIKAGYQVQLEAYYEDGDQSSDLLSKLRSDGGMQTDIEAADVITISIGGNNLMQAAKKSGYFLWFRVEYYDFSDVDFVMAEAGRQAFSIEWPQIVNELDVLTDGVLDGAVDAKIIMNTTYNPYWEGDKDINNILMRPKLDTYLHNDAANGINDIIFQYAHDSVTGNRMYMVADMHTLFNQPQYISSESGMNAITYMYIDELYLGFELRNPHPTPLGHELMGLATYQAFLSY